ncbi:branched-chain amino acid ABC transporter permease [Limnohabitans sp.]|uniref:branched-chain amino acid ABC transporter permease n=1 Tax=Limnohabitans sp. TaxID=1907725 RepID=UPI00286F9704|nr:branched-chain amino acid ABC transporter permease [Limnohabitans sp.]
MKTRLTLVITAVLLLTLALLPLYARWLEEPFLLTFSTRALVLALAALSLNIVLGFGGMVSFGHALYLGLGAYSVGILASHGVDNGALQLLITIVLCTVVGLATGWVSLRTSGIGFIMITLAFAQMFYYLFVSLKQYGGDDGLSISLRSNLVGLNMGAPLTLYYTAFACVLAVVVWTQHMVQAPFGMVLQACRMNERRMNALGFHTLRYKLSAYVLSCVIAGVAGFLYANLTGYASPAYLAWTVSGELIVMVVLGGMGTVLGPLVGALTLLGCEELLKGMTEHWPIILGPLIVLVVLLARRGLYGLALDWDARHVQAKEQP